MKETVCETLSKGTFFKVLAICVCILSFACDNLELDAIIAWTLARADVSLPASNRRDSADALRPFSCDDPLVLRFTLGFTAVTAVLDFISVPFYRQEQSEFSK